MSSQTDTISARTIALGTLVVLLAMGVRATFGLFMQPMGLAHGWSREVFSMAFALQNLVWGLACIFMGMLADRYGSGRTIALGALLYMLGLIGTRFATDEATLYLTAGVLVGLALGGFAGWAYRALGLPNLPPGPRRVAWRVLGVVTAVTLLVGGWLGRGWQSEQRQLLGMDTSVPLPWLVADAGGARGEDRRS